jgi:hypothetical protein
MHNFSFSHEQINLFNNDIVFTFGTIKMKMNVVHKKGLLKTFFTRTSKLQFYANFYTKKKKITLVYSVYKQNYLYGNRKT